MYEVNCIDLSTNKSFKKVFDSYYLLNKFKNKCKYSKKIKITSIINY